MPSSTHHPPAWGQSLYEEFAVPSGGTCLLRKLQPHDLLQNNMLMKTDVLGELVQQQIKQAQAVPGAALTAGPDEDKIVEKVMQTMTQPGNLDSFMDTIVLLAVVEPKLVLPPTNPEDRREGVIYLDTVPFNDKMAIMNAAMKSVNQLRSFREEPAPAVGTVATVAELPATPE